MLLFQPKFKHVSLIQHLLAVLCKIRNNARSDTRILFLVCFKTLINDKQHID